MNIRPHNRRLSYPLPFFAALLLFAAFANPSTATEKEDSTNQELSLATQELRVAVTLDSERITSFTQDDFRLTLDGQGLTITGWEEIHPAHLLANRRILIFIDEAFARPNARNQALQGLRQAFTDLKANTALTNTAFTIAVAAFDGERIELLTPWTSSPATLASTLEEASERPAFGLLRKSEQRRQASLGRRRGRLPEVGSFSGTGFAGSASSTWEEPEGRGDILRYRARRSALAVATTLKALADAEGGALLLLSGGWLPPSAPAAECETLAEPLLQAVIQFGFAVYPVDLAINLALTEGSPSVDGLLLRLAEANGGRFTQSATTSSSAESSLRQAQKDGRHHYRMSLLLPEAPTETAAELQVEVVDPAMEGSTFGRVTVLPKAALPNHGSNARISFPILLQEQMAIQP
jgi:hypothetical protein